MTIAEIRELRDKLEPYSSRGIQVSFPCKTDELCLTAFASTEERLKEMERVLEPYQKRFMRIDLQLKTDDNLCWTFIRRMDFSRFKSVLIPALKAEIEALLHRQKPEPLYAFVLGVSPDHNSVVIYWNTPSNWTARAAYYASTGYPANAWTKYNGPDFLCKPLADQKVWQPVWDELKSFEIVRSEFYKLTGGSDIFRNGYESRFRSTAIHALREVAVELEALPRTLDFIFYVQDYVGGGDELFLKLETIPEERLRHVLPCLFSNP